MWIDITEKEKAEYNKLVTHPLQSFEWGEFRKKTGVKVIRKGLLESGILKDGFTVTIHKVPKTKFSIGYFPKGGNPTKKVFEELKKVGKENNCIFIQLEPNIENKTKMNLDKDLKNSFHPLFTKYTFVLDLEKTEEKLLKAFHQKTRYNIRLAEKKGVVISLDNSEKAFKSYLSLTEETTKRQKFYAHTPSYHTKMWETLKGQTNTDNLSAHILTATYQKDTLAAWVLFVFHDTLYYPYGSSSSKHRNVMASNLIMWEAIKFGKKQGLKKFDMWGALGKDPDVKDPWYGFHKFKEGYGALHTEFVGSFDLVINPYFYKVYKLADKARWIYLKSRRVFGR